MKSGDAALCEPHTAHVRGARRLDPAEEARVREPEQAAFVDEHGALLDRAQGGHVPHRAVEARAAFRGAGVAAALCEAVRQVGRGAGDVLGEPGGRGRGGGREESSGGARN